MTGTVSAQHGAGTAGTAWSRGGRFATQQGDRPGPRSSGPALTVLWLPRGQAFVWNCRENTESPRQGVVSTRQRAGCRCPLARRVQTSRRGQGESGVPESERGGEGCRDGDEGEGTVASHGGSFRERGWPWDLRLPAVQEDVRPAFPPWPPRPPGLSSRRREALAPALAFPTSHRLPPRCPGPDAHPGAEEACPGGAPGASGCGGPGPGTAGRGRSAWLWASRPWGRWRGGSQHTQPSCDT